MSTTSTWSIVFEEVDDAHDEKIFVRLSKSTRIHELRILPSLHPRHFARLRHALEMNAQSSKTLVILDLTLNLLGDKGAKEIARVLRHPNTNLQRLVLAVCGIQDVGAIHIANALDENTILRELDVYSNLIGRRGCVAMGRLMVRNKTLGSLGIAGNAVSSIDGFIDVVNRVWDAKRALIVLLSMQHQQRNTRVPIARLPSELIRQIAPLLSHENFNDSFPLTVINA